MVGSQGTHLNPRKSQTDIWFFSGFEAMHLIRPPPADGQVGAPQTILVGKGSTMTHRMHEHASAAPSLPRQVWVRVHMPDRLCHRCPDSDISVSTSSHLKRALR